MEDLEDTEYFDEYALPAVLTPDSRKKYLIMNLLQKEETSQILNLVT